MDNFIITTAGRRIEFQPVAQRDIERAIAVVEKEYRANNEPLDIPWYYSIEPDANGNGGEKIFWDAASVAKDGTQEEKEAWVKHQDAVNRLAFAKDLRATEIMLLKGIKNEVDKHPTPEWIKEQEYWGIELPDDPRKLQLEYIDSEILITPIDKIAATKKVALLNLNGVASEEDIASVEATFQDAMAEAASVFLSQNLRQLTLGNGKSGTVEVGSVDLQSRETEHESSPLLEPTESESVGQFEPR